MIKKGIYRHYKNRNYKVMGTAISAETLEVMVIYQSLYNCEIYGDHCIWARPLKMFLEDVSEGVPRFELIEACEE